MTRRFHIKFYEIQLFTPFTCAIKIKQIRRELVKKRRQASFYDRNKYI